MDLIVYRQVKYHYSCITCVKCSKPTAEEFRLENDTEFYCRRCYTKHFTGDFENEEEEKNAPMLVSMQGTAHHKWQENSFRVLSRCNFCNTHIGFGVIGFLCTECKFNCHKECKDQVPSNCGEERKTNDMAIEVGKRVSEVRRKSLKNVSKFVQKKTRRDAGDLDDTDQASLLVDEETHSPILGTPPPSSIPKPKFTRSKSERRVGNKIEK